MRYTIKTGKSVSHHGRAHVVACLITTSPDGPDHVGVALDVKATLADATSIRLSFEPADLDDEASCAQLVRLAERIQIMVTAAANRRAGVAVVEEFVAETERGRQAVGSTLEECLDALANYLPKGHRREALVVVPGVADHQLVYVDQNALNDERAGRTRDAFWATIRRRVRAVRRP